MAHKVDPRALFGFGNHGLAGRWGREVGKNYSVQGFPIICRHHFDRVPWTTVKKRSVWSLARTFLTTNAEIRIDFDSPKRWMIFVRHPEHASLNWAVLNACR